MEAEVTTVRDALRTPRAAAIAGVISSRFGWLFSRDTLVLSFNGGRAAEVTGNR